MNMIYLQFTLILFQLALICSALAHDKQLYLLHSFCNQYHRSSMIIFNNLDWWNESRKHNNVQIVKFMSQFYLRITVTFTDMQPSCQIQEDTAGITPLFVLQYSTSPDFQKFLKQCFEEGQFSGKIIWLFFTSSALSPYLFNDLKDLNIRLDSNVLITIQDSEGKGQSSDQFWIKGMQEYLELAKEALNSYLCKIIFECMTAIKTKVRNLLELENDITLMETYNLGQNSNPQYHVVTQWDSKNTSLLLPPQLYKYNKQRRGNLQGYQLRAVAVTVNEFYTQIQKIGNRYEILGGYFAETFKNLADTLNFTYNITYLPGYAYGNTPTDNSSSWSGMIGMMQRHEADLSVCEASITIDRLEVMDFTMAVHTASRKLYIHEGIKELRMDWYFRPFSISTWLALITALFLFTFISTFLHYITHKTKRRTRRAGFLSNFFTIVTIMLQQGTEQPASLSIRLVLQSSAVLFLVVHVAYSAKLTALSTLYKPQPPVSHIRDLLKSSSWKFGIMDGSLPFNIFKTADANSLFGELWHLKLQPFPQHLMSSYESGLAEVLAESHFVFMGQEYSCQNTLHKSFTPTQACQILVLPQKYFPGEQVLALQKNSPYKEIINYSIMKMKSSGILRHLELKWVPQPRECYRMMYAVTEWIDIVPPFTGFIAMVATSVLILLLELVLHKYTYHKVEIRHKKELYNFT